MTNLVEIKNNQVVVDSRSVAKNFGKQNQHVNRDIENLIKKRCVQNWTDVLQS